MTSPQTPAVTVVIPAFNASEYIATALDSVIAQTWRDWVAVVANDGSTDTPELKRVLEPYLRQGPDGLPARVLYIEFSTRGGAAAARNAGMAANRSPFVAFLDADDQWHPTMLEVHLDLLAKHHDMDLVYADGYLFGHGITGSPRYSDWSPSIGEVTFESLILGRCNVLTSGVVARRAAIESVSGFDPSLRRAHDYDLWLRMVRRGCRISHSDQALVRYRVRQDGISGTTLAVAERGRDILQHISGWADLSERERAVVRRAQRRANARLAVERAKVELRAHDYRRARQQLFHAMRLTPNLKLSAAFVMSLVAPGILRRLQERRRDA
jgi:glycosyltransferase involved in cell wall biosynthesis